jgi:hypothetical protein
MHPGIRTTLGQGALLLAVLAAVAGCGSDDSDATATDTASDSTSPTASASTSATASPSASSDATTSASPSLPSTTDATEDVVLPACSSVWVVGQQLPQGYQGCTDDAGGIVQADGLYCEFGKPLFTYAKFFYAVENGPINKTETRLAKDKTYQQAVRKCGG